TIALAGAPVGIYFARQLVFERLDEVEKEVPENVEISMGPIATVMGEIYQYTLKGNEPRDDGDKVKYLSDLRTLQEWVVAPMLKNVKGVNEINSFGGYFRQYQIVVHPDRLIKYNITINDIFSAVGNNNRNSGGNVIEKYSEQLIVRGVGLIRDIKDIGNIVMKSYDGTPVYLKDVAEIKIGEAVRQGAAIINGRNEAVGGIVMMLRGENSREVVERVKQKVEEINRSNVLPGGIKIEPYYDRSDIISASINTVLKALLEGSVFVLLIIYILLRSFRGSVVVLISLMLSFLLTFIIMKVTGLGANLMTFGGLAISIGMKIDATIIQVENVQRHLSATSATDRKLMTVLMAVIEVRKPSILGELIIAITFIPLLALEGIEGKMFTPLALTVAITLFSSLLLSIFVIPVICGMFLKPQPEKESPAMKLLENLYRPVLLKSIRNKKKLLALAGAMLAATFLLIPRLGTEFLPIMDEGAFDMDVSLLPGVSLDKAMEINKLATEKLKKFPELETVVGRIGQTGVALDSRGADKTGYVGILKPKNKWSRNISREELTNEMREALESIPGIAFGFSQPIQCRIDETVAGTRSQLILKLFGNDMDILKSRADEIAGILSHIDGATDIVPERVSGQPYLNINIDREKIARFGLNIKDVQDIIEIAVAGKPASRFYEENRNFDIIVRLPESKRNSPETIGNILVPVKSGMNIPLAQIANISVDEGPVQVSRENGSRLIGIELNISGRDIGSFVEEAKEKLKNKVDLPPGYYIEWGGQFENQQKAMTRLMIILPLAIGLIFILLYLTFKSIRMALLVITNLPFALIGGVFSLWISGLYLSIPASVGFIVLFGVAVLNGVVLVSHINQLHRNDNMDLKEAIVRGSMDRLRPVIMTASIGIFSLIPMMYAGGTGSEIQKPLAVVVVGGLITSTILTLFIIPSLYEWFEGRKKV
ncbi:MAG TPA: CusA/CzcA family heavy metal efflux RND transporter, partial [Ignavibacteriales bacterium]|nr:CusA/CzcA family heavy metal efflux RND transporter [Ignavibacteriales bacterium]